MAYSLLFSIYLILRSFSSVYVNTSQIKCIVLTYPATQSKAQSSLQSIHGCDPTAGTYTILSSWPNSETEPAAYSTDHVGCHDPGAQRGPYRSEMWQRIKVRTDQHRFKVHCWILCPVPNLMQRECTRESPLIQQTGDSNLCPLPSAIDGPCQDFIHLQ